MKHISRLLVLFLSLIVFSQHASAVGQSEIDTSKENTSFILHFFSTELLINFVFAVIAVVLTVIISKIVRDRMGGYLESTM
jgi:hypothetical protein